MENILFYGVEIRVKGKVQGVGFRPFVWLLAQKYQFIGDVNNDGEGVLIRLLMEETAQNHTALLDFLQDLYQQYPPLAHINEAIYTWKNWDDLSSTTEFVIRESENSQMDTQIVPDAATCAACLDDLFNPHNRRFHYPFTNCTHCGPRFTIIRKIPYDRPNTSMSHFSFCPTCEKEYKNPADRRFHAQPNACDHCGPYTWLTDGTQILAEKETALSLAVSYLQQGKIVAVKGIGGFHLSCDATNSRAIQLLRQRKQRATKPLAIMVPSIDWLKNLSTEEKDLLQSSAAPIVLLAKEKVSQVCGEIAPHLNEIGVMLPSNPLQHLLLRQIQTPLVMTSANQRGLPPVLDNQRAFKELASLADYWLLHNRDILQRADDSLARVAFDGVEILRRARGYVPDELALNIKNNQNILALGADLKNTFCLLKGDKVVVTQHLGDADNEQIQQQISTNIALFQQLYQFAPKKIIVDAHPDYFTHTLGQYLAQKANVTCHAVLHHHAHIMAVLAEHQRAEEKVIGLALDGIGMGEEQLWGGECLLVEKVDCKHLGGLPAVAWLGGNLAAKQPWRNLLAHFEQFVPNWQSYPESEFILVQPWQALLQAKAKGINAPLVSSAGRLFDAMSCALGLHQTQISWEGEAACHLEALAWQYQRAHSENVKRAVDFNEISSLLTENNQIDLSQLWKIWLTHQGDTAQKAWLFHRLLAKAFAELALKQANQHQVQTVVLSGGVCHNQLLRYWLRQDLAQLEVLSAHQYPMGDGGVALGQAVIGAMLAD